MMKKQGERKLKKKTKILLGVLIVLIAVFICYVVARIIICNNKDKEHTFSAVGIYNLNLLVDENFEANEENEARAKNETISENELLEYLEKLKSQGKIKDYHVETGGIVVTLNNGGGLVFPYPLPDGFQANPKNSSNNRNINNLSISRRSTLSVLTAQPCDDILSDVFDNSARIIESSNIGYKLIDDVDTSDVTLDFMKTLSNYRVIIWNAHGGCYDGYGSVFLTGENWTNDPDKYIDDEKEKRILRFVNGTVAVTPAFFDHYYKENPFNDTLIYLGCCSGAKDSTLSNVLIKNGAEAVLAYNNDVNINYSRNMCQTIFNELVKKDGNTNSTITISEALKRAKKQNGEKDPTHAAWYDWVWKVVFNDNNAYVKKADRAELILTENDDNSFRLVDENNKENNSNNTENDNTNTDYNKIYENYINGTIIPEVGLCYNFDRTLTGIAENKITKK